MLSVFLTALLATGEPVPPPAPKVSLEEAVAVVLAHAPARKAAEASADGARAAERLADVWPNPTAEVRIENWMFDGWRWTPGLDPDAPPGLDVFAVVTQPVLLGGKRGARRAIAGADRDAAEAILSQTDRALTMEAVRLYLDVVRARDLLAALAEQRDGLATLQAAMAARVREGVAAAADLAKFQAEAARVDVQMARTRIDRDRSLAFLNALMGSGAPLTPDQLAPPAWRDSPSGAIEALAAQAVDRAPEVRAARAQESRAARVLSLERALQVPDLAVAGGYKRTAGRDTAVVGVTVPLPLFDRNRRAVAVAVGEARAAASAREAVEARVRAEARAVIEAARELGERARRIDEDVLAPAETVRRAARAAFREGAADILNLVDAERVYLEARRETLQVKLDATASAIEAWLILGERVLQ